MTRTTGYAQLGDDRIAYQIVGDGPIDVLFSFGMWGSFDVEWEDPAHRLFYKHVAKFSRVIQFDQRGSGASDPVSLEELPPWESFAEEVVAVMDAVGSEEAAIVAQGAAVPIALLLAAIHPERVSALVLWLATARYLEAEDYPIGWSHERFEEVGGRFQSGWGTGGTFDRMYPSSVGDDRRRGWYSKLQRSMSSPRTFETMLSVLRSTDARFALPSITAPTLVMHPANNGFIPVAWGRYVADHIEGAQFIELPGRDVAPFWDSPELTLDAIEEHLTGIRRSQTPDRRLASVLFTDVVDSTRIAAQLGDTHWRRLIEHHDQTSRELVENYGGHLVRTTGDGLLATFDGPGRAIQCASSLRQELAGIDLQIRCGIHVGEIEVVGGDVAGIAVHLAARIMAVAEPDEILVSRTMRDLSIGSEILFEDRGSHDFKGFGEGWQTYSVSHPAAS